MRAAIFTDTYLPDVNGVAKTLGRWADYLNRQGIECKVFAPAAGAHAVEEARSSVERFSSMPFLLYPDCKVAFPNPIHISKTLREFRPTIIHAATPFNLGVFGRRYARRNGVPFVGSYHTHFDQYLSFYKLSWMEPMVWRYMSWFYKDCRRVYVPSPSAMEHLSGRGIPNMEVWGRGIESERFRPEVERAEVCGRYGIDPGKFIALFVGRLALEKSIDVLLEAFERVPGEARGRMELVIAGDGPLYKELAARYGEGAECASNVRLLSFVHGQALSELYAAADVFLFPSSTETFGNVVLESLASGTPVIGAAAGGVKDNVQHGVTGLLCPPGDAGAFSDALLRLYADGQLRVRLAQAGRAYALSRSWEAVFHRLLHSYRNVAEEETFLLDSKIFL